MSRGVTVLSAASGGGHVRAADALVAAFGASGISASHVEVLQFTTPFLRRLYSDYYVDVVNERPWLLGAVYGLLGRPRRFERSRRAFDLLHTRRLVSLLQRANPGLVLCTHFLPAEIVVHLRRRGVLSCQVGVVMTDFDVHALWAYPEADWYFVAGAAARESAERLGIPPARIHMTGIPIAPAFGERRGKIEARSRMGLHPELPTLLVAAGAFGMGPVEALTAAVQRVRHPVQVVVMCGRNDALRRRLAATGRAAHPTKIVGHTDEMDAWMATADVLVGKAGGLTCAEALARGLVPVIVNPIPGPEERNAAILVDEGAAVGCGGLRTLTATVDDLLGDAGRLERMRQNALRMARPDAASVIAAIVARLSQRAGAFAAPPAAEVEPPSPGLAATTFGATTEQ